MDPIWPAVIAGAAGVFGSAITGVFTVVIPGVVDRRARRSSIAAEQRERVVAKLLAVLRDLQDLANRFDDQGGAGFQRLAISTLAKSVTELEVLLTPAELPIAWMILDAGRHASENRDVQLALVGAGRWVRGEVSPSVAALEYGIAVGRDVPSIPSIMVDARGVGSGAPSATN